MPKFSYEGKHFGYQETASRLVDAGTNLTNIISKFNDTFGGMIFNTYCTCLLLSTISLYGASSVFLPNTTLNKKLILSFTSAEFILATMSFLRVYYLTDSAQKLSKAIKVARAKVEYLTGKENIIGNGNVRLLRHQLSVYSNSPINPLSTFSLSNGTLLSTSATVLTYLIILIQFKLTEK